MATENNSTPLTPDEAPEKGVGCRDLIGRIKDMAAQCEMLLFESPANKYQPAPPDGWFALRSSKRRVFMRLNNGRRPPPEEIQERLKTGEFNELSLPNVKGEPTARRSSPKQRTP